MTLKTGLTLTLMLTTLLAALPASAKKPPIGDVAPGFTLRSDGPFNLRLSEQKGYIVVVGFWASWCRSCPIQLKALNELGQKYQDKGVKVWGITLDKNFDDALHHVQHYNLRFSVLQDSEFKVSERYDIDDLPATFIVDRDGKLRLMSEGFNPGDEVKLDQFLQTLVNE
jgi:peroxiredoxin